MTFGEPTRFCPVLLLAGWAVAFANKDGGARFALGAVVVGRELAPSLLG
jgi:hypothetical protein